jgi:multicomponent K+:H+ antiporter subunit A
MANMILTLPIITGLVGSLAAFLYGVSSLKFRLSITRLSWILALAPLSAFSILLILLPGLSGGQAIAQRFTWLPTFNLDAWLYLDSLSALFALLVTGIGTLVILYTGYYFKGDQTAWRFLAYILLFTSSMLGLVLAGDLITLFVFWEGTSVTSFLLVAYKYKDQTARRGAFKALLITAGGGIALLAGVLVIWSVAGSTDFVSLLSSGESLRQSAWYPMILGLIALGAFTKSAQMPFHIWLPEAMSAPTPASAFLHSATMVKAGIYLLARLNPVLGNTDQWFWLLSIFGMLTMVAGAYLGLKQNDLKGLLAYSTISQLGVFVMLIGQDTEIAFKALVVGVIAHALYKSALFLSAGIIDHESGTRDLRRLGGLRRAMPVTFLIASLAALSMAGLPPMFGFLAKETLLATVTHPSVPEFIDWIFTGAVVFSGAFLLAQAGLYVVDTFLGKTKIKTPVHEAPAGMWLAAGIPAIFSLIFSLLPEPEPLAAFLADAAASAFGAKVKVSLALWTGLTVPLLLSIVAVTLGSGLFIFRQRVRQLQSQLAEWITLNWLYNGSINLIDRLAYLATRLQSGLLRRYLAIMLASIGILILSIGRVPITWQSTYSLAIDLNSGLAILRLFTLLLSAASSAATILLRRDLFAILAAGASGLSITVLMILEPAPDVALVQIVVDILLIVILILALSRLPRQQRDRAWELTFRQSWPGLARDGLIALGAGLVMAVITLTALTSRPRLSQVTPYYEANAKPLAGAKDIVGAIITDFRGFDTLVEISVFAMAGLGVYTLLRFASRKAGDHEHAPPSPRSKRLPSAGIGGGSASPFIAALAYISLPLSLVIASVHIMYGHDQPGDGFTAGVIISLAVGLWYVVFGYDETKHRLKWIKPLNLIGIGLLLAFINLSIPVFLGQSVFSPLDYGERIGLPLPAGFHISTAFVFEVAICLSVAGGIFAILDALGHPSDDDSESKQLLEEIE